MRISEKKEEIRIAEEQWIEESKRVREILKLSSNSNNRVNQIKSEELRIAWTRNINRLKKKFEAMNQEQNPIRNQIPGVFRDTLIRTEELEEAYGETIPSIAIYGRIEASENVKEFLRLPANVRLYSRIEKHQGEHKVEESAA